MRTSLLRTERLRRGWSQDHLAGFAGVSVRTVQRAERGEALRPDSIQLLCKCLNKSPEDLGLFRESEELDGSHRPEISSTHAEEKKQFQYLNAVEIGFFPRKPETIEISIPAETNQTVGLTEERDWTAWFGIKQAQIITTINMWRGRALFCDEVQTMVDQEIKTMDQELQQYSAEKQQAISRRQALITIAALPTAIMWRSALVSDTAIEDFLPQCAASITTCWHLMKGAGFTTIVDILSNFAPLLATLALRPSKYQQAAARLALQASVIQGILAMHQLKFTVREAHCHDAVRYANMSQDNKLKAAALMYLGYTFSHCYYPRQPQKAIPIFHKALHALGDEISLLRSDILMGLGEAYAQCREEQEALRYIGLAQEHFPAYPEHDPSFIYADCGLNTLYQWQGKTYLQLAEHFPDAGYQHTAADSLVKSVGINSISARSTGETAIYQADAARVLGELKIYAYALRQATQIARDIGSQRRFNDAILVYQRTPDKWIKEPEIRALANDVFKQLPSRKAN